MEINKILNLSKHFLNVKKCRILYKTPDSIPFLIISITNKCNLRCKSCDQWKTDPKLFSQELSTKEWFSVIDSAAKMHTHIITITGGEPLLRQDIFQILERIHKKRMSTHFCTNGALLNNNEINKMMYSPPKSISISIDGHEPKINNELRGKNCFNTIIKNIKLLKEKIPNIKIGINFVMSKKNYRNMDQMVALSQNLDVDQLNIIPIHTNLRHRNKPLKSFGDLLFTKEDVPKIKAEIKKFMHAVSQTNLQTLSKTFVKGIPEFYLGKKSNYCYAGYISCEIDALGRVFPCGDIDGIENVRNKRLEDIWKSNSFQQLRKKVHNCKSNCWDTTHSELCIRCSIPSFIRESYKILKDVKYYLD